MSEVRVLRLAGYVGETVLAVVGAAVASLSVLVVLDRVLVGLPEKSFIPAAGLATGAAVLLAGLVLLAVLHRWRWWATPLVWAGLSALTTLCLGATLQGTKFYLNGISGDQLFRTQYLTRMTSSASLADLNFADLPPYYPAGWFWLGGRFARLIGLDGWAAYRPFAIITMAVAGVLAFTLWSVVAGRRTAVLLAMVTTVIGLRTAAYEPYSWVLAACLPPMSVVAWRHIRGAAAGEHASRWPVAGVGVYLGACGAVYTLLFGFFSALLAAMGIGAAVAARRWRAAAAVLGTLTIVAVVAVSIMLLVWMPYLRAVLSGARLTSGAAMRFLPEIGALWPMPMFTLSALGAITLVGVAWIVLRWRGNPMAQALGIVAAGVYAWYGLSTLMLLAGSTLLAFRLEPPLQAALACAGVLGLLEALRWVLRRAATTAETPITGAPITQTRWVATAAAATGGVPWPRSAPRRSIIALAGVLAAAAMLSMVQAVPSEYAWARAASLSNYYPSGHNATGGSDSDQPGSWTDDLAGAISELAAGTAPERLVLLSAQFELLAYWPYRGFQSNIEQYANPLADYQGRNAAIKSWAASTNQDELLDRLDRYAYRAPTVFVLRIDGPRLLMPITEDGFPDPDNVKGSTVTFDEHLFITPAFTRRDVGPFAVLVRNPSRDRS